MKYNTFKGLLIGGALLVVLGGFGTCVVFLATRPAVPVADPLPPAVAVPAAEPVARTAPPPTATASVGTKELPLGEMDRAIIAAAAVPISGDKVKDAVRGRSYKVNLYKDAGESRVNRAKIDLDRDEKWDEKWTFEKSGGTKRQIAPLDDENYSIEYALEGQRWLRVH